MVGLVGVLVGWAITSAFTFWAVRRVELVQGSVAARALDEEMQWLQNELSLAAHADRPTQFDAGSAVSVWRDQRKSLVLYVDPKTFRDLGAAVRACERWARETGADRTHCESQRQDLISDLIDSRVLLKSLADWLQSQHAIFILHSLLRWAQGSLGLRPRGWERPELTAQRRKDPEVNPLI